MKWLAKLAGAVMMSGAVLGLAVIIVAPIALEPPHDWIPGYVLMTFVGMVVGVALGLGAYWAGAGRFLPERDRWTLPVAAMIIGVIVADISFFMYAALVDPELRPPVWATAVFVLVIVLLVVAAVVHQVLYATFARREVRRWPVTPIGRLIPGKVQRVRGVIRPVSAMLQAPVGGHPCVWWSLDVLEECDDTARLALQREQGIAFALEDASGQVRISLGAGGRVRATLSRVDQRVVSVGFDDGAAAALASFGVAANPGMSLRMLFLGPGRQVSILGRCTMVEGSLVLGPGDDGQLVVASEGPTG